MKRIREVNRNTYDEWDQIYSDPEVATRWTQWFDGSLVEAVIAHLPFGARVLDIGCGVGFSEYVIQRMKKRFDVRFYGVDASACAIEYLRRHSSVRWEGLLRWDATAKLPFCEKVFDVSMACEILEHLEQPELMVQELARVADKMVVTVPNHLEVDTEYHVWEFDEADVFELLSPYGETKTKIVRNNCQILGVCECKSC